MLAGLHGLIAGRDDEIALADAGNGGGLIVARKLLHGDAGGDIAAAERRVFRLQDIDEFAVGVFTQARKRDERVIIGTLLADGERNVLPGLNVARERKDEGVADATVNFMTQKMIVEFAEGADEKKTMKAVLKACKKVEPDCEIEL